MSQQITVQATVHAPIKTVWSYWNEPEHITKWNAASDDWHTPHAKNDLRIGGTFIARMEAKDKSFGFDFGGTYTDVVPEKRIAYTMGDGRTVDIVFTVEGDQVNIRETFDAETQNSVEMQRAGWQAIMDRFKAYAEANR
jgi:uncharacterized protein YndB with AHSA1/START domain